MTGKDLLICLYLSNDMRRQDSKGEALWLAMSLRYGGASQ